MVLLGGVQNADIRLLSGLGVVMIGAVELLIRRRQVGLAVRPSTVGDTYVSFLGGSALTAGPPAGPGR
jgi:hypothetical protein